MNEKTQSWKSVVRHKILVAADFNPPEMQKVVQSRRDDIFIALFVNINRPDGTQNIYFFRRIKIRRYQFKCLRHILTISIYIAVQHLYFFLKIFLGSAAFFKKF